MTDHPERKQITLDEIKTLEDLHRVFNETNNDQLEWAKRNIEITRYPQAVQTELAMHRTDLIIFAINAVVRLMHAQEVRIAELERLNKGDGK